ncbi:outer membrane protein [Spongiimicrobium sp. 2-473A-2-J]|uniref:outer membrane protein n=1 Tax=Eudoraea algarum TaxID=3417568 RepID=UPI003D363115
MKKCPLIVGCLLLVLCFTIRSQAQGSVSIHAGPSFPLGDFTDIGSNGNAAVGAHIGAQYVYPLGKNGWGLFGGVDLHYNGSEKDAETLSERILMQITGDANVHIKNPKYLNVPVTAGLRYTFKTGPCVSIFAHAGAASNFLKIMDYVLTIDGETYRSTQNWATKLGYTVGAGIWINDRFSIAVDYLGLGEHTYSGTLDIPALGGQPAVKGDYDNGKQKVAILALRVGVRL